MFILSIVLTLLVILAIIIYFRGAIRILPKIQTKGPGFFYALSHDVVDLHNYMEKNNLISQHWGHVWYGNRLIVYANHPEAAKFLLTTKPEKGIRKTQIPLPPSYRKWLETNLVFVDGDLWRRHRSLLSPSFNDTSYRNYYPKISLLTDKAINKIDTCQQKSKGELDMTPLSKELSLDILGAAIFDYDFGMLDDKPDLFYNHFDATNTRPAILDAFPFLEKFDLIPGVRRTRKGWGYLINYMIDIIKKKAAQDPTQHHHDIISQMVHASDDNGKLSFEEIVGNAILFFIAGHETTTQSLLWAVYELSQNQHVQEKLFQEIQNKIGDKNPNFEEIDLEYLDCFISENLRLHSALALFPTREATSDLDYNGLIIPKGSLLSINFYTIHRNPEIWTAPEKFDPDRFLPEQKKKASSLCVCSFFGRTTTMYRNEPFTDSATIVFNKIVAKI